MRFDRGIRTVLAVGLLLMAASICGCGMGSIPIEAVISEYSVTVSPESVTVAVGSNVQLTATVVDTDGDTLSVQVVWASGNPAVATVAGTGVVAGIAEGVARIAATYSGSSASVDVLVQ